VSGRLKHLSIGLPVELLFSTGVAYGYRADKNPRRHSLNFLTGFNIRLGKGKGNFLPEKGHSR
jgi:hypothetical protein